MTGLFPLLILLNQRRSPPLRLQVSDRNTVRIMCDVPFISPIAGNLLNVFLVWLPNFSLNFVTFVVAPVINSMNRKFMSHIRCVWVQKL